jgi:hypothetical protein
LRYGRVHSVSNLYVPTVVLSRRAVDWCAWAVRDGHASRWLLRGKRPRVSVLEGIQKFLYTDAFGMGRPREDRAQEALGSRELRRRQRRRGRSAGRRPRRVQGRRIVTTAPFIMAGQPASFARRTNSFQTSSEIVARVSLMSYSTSSRVRSASSAPSSISWTWRSCSFVSFPIPSAGLFMGRQCSAGLSTVEGARHLTCFRDRSRPRTTNAYLQMHANGVIAPRGICNTQPASSTRVVTNRIRNAATRAIFRRHKQRASPALWP